MWWVDGFDGSLSELLFLSIFVFVFGHDDFAFIGVVFDE